MNKWRIVVPRQVMKKFFGTDREYVCELAGNFLSEDEKAMLHTIAVGKRAVSVHVDLHGWQ